MYKSWLKNNFSILNKFKAPYFSGVLLLLLVKVTFAQEELVPDPGFDKFIPDTNYITGAIEAVEFKNLTYWFNPTDNSPDYYCACPDGATSLYTNETSIGLLLLKYPYTEARDYAATKLTKKLDSTKIYYIQLKFSISPDSRFGINRIGIFFNKDSVHNSILTNLDYKPQIQCDSTLFYNIDIPFSRFWYNLNYVFKPDIDDYNYIYIGNFYKGINTDTMTRTPNNINTTNVLPIAYYNFKTISIIEVNPNYNLIANDTIICEGQNATLSYASTYPGHTYSWYTSTGFVSNNLNAIVQPQQTTTYYLYTTDNYHAVCDCNPPILDSVTVTVINYDVSGVNATTYERNLCSGDTIQFGIVSQNGYSYKWQPPYYLSNDTAAKPFVKIPWYMENNTLIYNITITNSQNQSCTLNNDLAFKIVINFCPDSLEPQIYIPNVFSPNGDGENDEFKLTTQNIKNLKAAIYNRWGIPINTINGIEGKWQGKTIAGDNAPTGIYYVIITAEGMDKKTYHYSGYVHIY